MPHFPSWRYHSELPPIIVKTPKEDAKLGEGWYHSPADIPDATVPAVPDAEVESDPETAAAKRKIKV